MNYLDSGKRKTEKSEDQIQAECFAWHWNTLPHERRMLFHVNQKARNAIEGNRMKALGVVPGVSDLIYMRGPTYIEMKTPDGVQSKDQQAFQKVCESLGYTYLICRSLEQFQEIIGRVRSTL